jgi:lysine decarboxylase
VLNALDLGYSGHELASALRYDHGIQVEMSELHQALLLITPGHNREQIDGLVEALRSLPQKPPTLKFSTVAHTYRNLAQARNLWEHPLLTVREAFESPPVSLKLDEAVDRICAELLYCYPPGVPLAYPGQRLSPEAIEHIKTQRSHGGYIQGGADATLETVLTVENDHD